MLTTLTWKVPAQVTLRRVNPDRAQYEEPQAQLPLNPEHLHLSPQEPLKIMTTGGPSHRFEVWPSAGDGLYGYIRIPNLGSIPLAQGFSVKLESYESEAGFPMLTLDIH